MRVAELAEQTTGGNRLRSRPFGHRRSERNAPTFCIIHYQTVPSAVQDDPDHKTFFLHNDELYERAKKRGEPFNEFAVIALAQIHHISDVPAHADREANVQVMHDLLPWGEN